MESEAGVVRIAIDDASGQTGDRNEEVGRRVDAGRAMEPIADARTDADVRHTDAEAEATQGPELRDPKLLLNRETSWLAFNERVLGEATDAKLPVLERLKFIGIVGSNLDEFFMVRVAGLKQQLASLTPEKSDDGLTAEEQLTLIADRVHALVQRQHEILLDQLLPELAKEGLHLLKADALNAEQKAAAQKFFQTNVMPALTPLAVDPGHPFPHLRNKAINLALQVVRSEKKRKKGTPREKLLAVVQVPSMLPRLVKLPAPQGTAFVLIEDLIARHASELFPGYEMQSQGTCVFRVLRNWDLEIDEEESEDLLMDVQAELRRRDRGSAVRLTISANASPEIEEELRKALQLEPRDVYRLVGPHALFDLMAIGDADPRPELRVPVHYPVVPYALREAERVIDVVGQRDVLLHHPYESFDPVVRFIAEAAEDPNVLAIKQTLYRTSGDSPFVRALSRAADNGKQVTAFVELKARFDEANNVAWARRLEENGVHVVYSVYGLPNAKTHAKVSIVVRREGGGIRRYVHLGTGNYNPTTARFYTDVSYFTARNDVADDVTALFNLLTGYSEPPSFRKLVVAPFHMKRRVLQLIEREADRAKKGEPARIAAKMNSLVDPAVIHALYAASRAGVQVDLVVRGICCLRPGVPGMSDNIRVTSIVDQFLEHCRVFAFGAGDKAEVYVASADWMPRNFVRRVELLFPVEDKALKARLLDEVLGTGLSDDVKSHVLQPDGTYVQKVPGAHPVRSQMLGLELARKAAEPPPAPVFVEPANLRLV